MSHVLLVFESMFGNTEEVARAVADGVGLHVPVDVLEVGVAPTAPPEEVALIVVGGPTHAFGLSRATTRRDAAARRARPPVSPGIGVREWLENLEPRPGLRGAAFGTRVATTWVPGSAANGIGRRLRRRGVELVVPARSFHVTGMEGPLVEGELERARAWGEQLGATCTVSAGDAR